MDGGWCSDPTIPCLPWLVQLELASRAADCNYHGTSPDTGALPSTTTSTQHNTGWVDIQSWIILRYPHDFHLIHHFPRYNSELREVLEPLFRETSIIQPDSRLRTPAQSHAVLAGGGKVFAVPPDMSIYEAETSPADQ